MTEGRHEMHARSEEHGEQKSSVVATGSPRRGGILVLLAAVALGVGIVIGTVSGPQVPASVAPYLPIAVVAALDAVFGGVRAYLDGIFDSKVFVVSFVFNVLVAALIVWLGDQLGVGTQLSTAIVVVLGIRIFGNAAALRRRLFGA
jgi:small basic protein